MARYTCTECDGEVELDTSNLGPVAAIALQSPLRVLCDHCITAEALVVHEPPGDLPWLLLRGAEFRRLCGAFTRSEHPRVVGSYDRDQQ